MEIAPGPRATRSWWRQYGGDAIVGAPAGQAPAVVASRLESIDTFRRRHPNGRVLVPNDPQAHDYGANPYPGYDRSATPSCSRAACRKASNR